MAALDFANTPTALISDGEGEQHAEPWVAFPFDEIDAPAELHADTEGNLTDAAQGLRRLLQWCWNSNESKINWPRAFRKFVVVSALFEPQLVNSEPMHNLAKQLGVTKAALSKYAVVFSKEFDLTFRNTRNAEGRENMRKARLRQVDGKGRVMGRQTKKKARAVDRPAPCETVRD